MQSLTAYIRQPELLDADAVEQLAALVERFPYFQSARMMYVLGLYQQQDERFGAELRKAAINLPDRTRLFQLIEGPAMEPKGPQRRKRLIADADSDPAGTVAEDASPDRTQSLIESFLAQQPDPPSQRRSRPVDASVDYMAYLMQQDDAQPAPQSPPVAPPVTSPEEEDDEIPADTVIDAQNGNEEAYLTETLARIYIKQGKYIKAIEIIRRLSLRNPKKNRYFADQIRFLEKLIAIQRAADNEISNNK